MGPDLYVMVLDLVGGFQAATTDCVKTLLAGMMINMSHCVKRVPSVSPTSHFICYLSAPIPSTTLLANDFVLFIPN
ncbi:hypothetical protein L1987_85429 [Smallanthus sonchifolius]|uniref:Uncharacterized protein n=1 Tax=Smallanthus sonchifolius TaxID=185202 RepID=A0ACB8XWI0_9ASTR|nr:hypothetical protein L1987_85429 [Smallanthus sonchifolius]